LATLINRTRSSSSAVIAATGASAKRVAAHAALSNIQAGTSDHRIDSSSAAQQRKTSPPLFSITS